MDVLQSLISEMLQHMSVIKNQVWKEVHWKIFFLFRLDHHQAYTQPSHSSTCSEIFWISAVLNQFKSLLSSGCCIYSIPNHSQTLLGCVFTEIPNKMYSTYEAR